MKSILSDNIGPLPIRLIILYACFANVSYYTKLFAKNFHSNNTTLSDISDLVLTFFAGAAALFGVGYQVYAVFAIVWWSPLVFILASYLAVPFFVLMRGRIPLWILGVSGFVSIPLFGYLLIHYLP
jgi:hypothetical protein